MRSACDDPAFQASYLRICQVLSIFTSDPTFFPRFQDMEELNPTRDPVKRRLHRIEAAWDWRDRVLGCLRCQDQLCGWEWPWRRRYCTPFESHAFWHFYFTGAELPELGRAVVKLEKSMERKGVFWE